MEFISFATSRRRESLRKAGRNERLRRLHRNSINRLRVNLFAQTAEKSRLHAAASTETTFGIVREDIEENIKHLASRMKALVERGEEHIKKDDGLNSKYEILFSVGGIGKLSAIKLLGERLILPGDMSVRQLVAHAGLDPCPHKSGTSINKPARVSKRSDAEAAACHLRDVQTQCDVRW